MSTVIQVKNLSKTFKKGLKKTHVLKDISFSVEQGKISGFLGANGSGKTTTMKCLLNLIWPCKGECLFFENKKLSADIWSRIGFLPEHPYFYDFLTGEEFLLFYGRLSSPKKTKADIRSQINYLLKKVDLEKDRDKKLREYSKGMLQKIGLLQACIHEPDLLILDEPMSGLDFNGRFYVMEIIKQLASQGTSVFFSSHLLFDVERLCENLVILKEGEVIFEGAMKEFLSSSEEGIDIQYLDEKNEMQKRAVSDNDQVQQTIDQLRSQKLKIISLQRRESKNLEETFAELALKKRKE